MVETRHAFDRALGTRTASGRPVGVARLLIGVAGAVGLIPAAGTPTAATTRGLPDEAASVGVHQASAPATDVRGAWRARTYVLATGERHDVEGLITFTTADWSVVYFVVPDGSDARRGEGGGGTYTMDDDGIVFTHLFHISAGQALPGLPASELRMVARRDESDAPTEVARVDRRGDRLTIFFPSGNRLVFERSSGFE